MSCSVKIQWSGTALRADAETSYSSPTTCAFAWTVRENPQGRWHLHPTDSKESIPDSSCPVPAKASGQTWVHGFVEGDSGSVQVVAKFYDRDGSLADECETIQWSGR